MFDFLMSYKGQRHTGQLIGEKAMNCRIVVNLMVLVFFLPNVGSAVPIEINPEALSHDLLIDGSSSRVTLMHFLSGHLITLNETGQGQINKPISYKELTWKAYHADFDLNMDIHFHKLISYSVHKDASLSRFKNPGVRGCLLITGSRNGSIKLSELIETKEGLVVFRELLDIPNTADLNGYTLDSVDLNPWQSILLANFEDVAGKHYYKSWKLESVTFSENRLDTIPSANNQSLSGPGGYPESDNVQLSTNGSGEYWRAIPGSLNEDELGTLSFVSRSVAVSHSDQTAQIYYLLDDSLSPSPQNLRVRGAN